MPDESGRELDGVRRGLEGVRILAVDDVPVNLNVLVDLLSDEDVDIAAAITGPDALKAAEQRRPDIVLLDVRMPGMDGYETCRRLRALPDMDRVPVIFLTAQDAGENVQQGYEAGGVDYVTKPVNKDVLVECILTHLGR